MVLAIILVRSKLGSLIVWLVVTLVVFLPSLGAGFVWDDHPLIEHDARIHTLPSVAELITMPFFPDGEATSANAPEAGNAYYFRPLLKAVHALEYQAFGARPFGYHLVNLLLHATNVLLALVWLRRRLGDAPGIGAAVALGVIPFALHPSRPLAVTWVSGSGDLLLGTFVLLALLIWQRRVLGLGSIVALAACSLAATLCKESGVVLGFVLLAETLLLQPRDQWRKRFSAIAWLGAVQIAVLVVRARVVDAHPKGPFEDGGVALISRVAVSFGFELKALVLPTNLRHQLNYALGQPLRLPSEVQWLGVIGLLAGVLLIGLWLAARSRPSWRASAADSALFALLLLPGLNVVAIGSQGGTLSERYLYVPMLGIAALCTRGLERWIAVRGQRSVISIATLWGIGYAALSVAEIGNLQSDRTLYARFVQQDPAELFSVDGLLRDAVRSGDHELARSCNAHRLCVIADVLTATTNETQRERALVEALLGFIEVELHVTRDADPDHLIELRSVLDAIADGRPTKLTVQGQTIALEARGEALPHAQAGKLGLQRAIAHARTLELQRAAEIIQPLMQSGVLSAELCVWRARIAIGLGDPAGALVALNQTRACLPPAFSAQLANVSRNAAAPSERCDPADAGAAALALARAGLPGLARKRLAHCTTSSRAEALLVAAEIDLNDRRPDLARARLLELRQAGHAVDRDQQALFNRLLADAQGALDRAARQASEGEACLACDQLMSP